MGELVRDYLALPEVQFAAEHWRALVVIMLLAFALAWFGSWIDRRR